MGEIFNGNGNGFEIIFKKSLPTALSGFRWGEKRDKRVD